MSRLITVLTIFIIRLNRDIRQLISSAECLQNAALELGLYRVQESCQNIRRANTTIKEDAEVSNVRREADPIHAEDEIGRLRNSVACARSTIDYFYNNCVA